MNEFLNRQKKLYPLMEDIDMYKMLFQACFLNAHALNDNVINRLYLEYSQNKDYVDEAKCLYEYIDNDIVRVNLKGFPFDIDELKDIFLSSGKVALDKSFSEMLKDYDGDEKIIKEYQNLIPSHSIQYKNNYHPSYRLVYTKYLPIHYRVFMINNFIKKVRNKETGVIICCTGRKDSGFEMVDFKDVCVINSDDYTTSKEGIDELEEILKKIKGNMGSNKVWLVKGHYSYLKKMRKYYDYLCVFVISKELQKEKIESSIAWNNYLEKVRINEDKYFSSFPFIEQADLLV